MKQQIAEKFGVIRVHPDYWQSMRNTVLWVALLALAATLVLPLSVISSMRGIAGYLPLHMLFETIAIVVSLLIFAVGWHAHARNLPGNIVLLACAFFGVGLLDFAHMLSYPGMPDFLTPGNPEKGIDFWLVARSLAAIALLAVVLMPWRPFASPATRYVIFAAVLAATALAYWLILFHQDAMPHTFIAGEGLTSFKKAAEYLIISLNLVTVFVLWRSMSQPQPFNAPALFGAVCVMALSEYFFTLYASVTDVFNLMGHIFKSIAYLFLYRVFFVATVETPYRQMQRSETRFRTLFESTSDAVMLVGEHGFIDCNKATLAMFGCATKEEFCSLHPADISPPVQPGGRDSRALAERNNATAMENGRHFFEWVGKRTDNGNTFITNVLLNRMELDGKAVLQATVRDITARKLAERALQESEEMLRRAQAIAHIGHFKFNPATGVVVGSDELFVIFGLTRERFQFSDFLNSVHPEDRAFDEATIKSAIHHKTGYEIEHRLLLGDGTLKWVKVIGQFADATPEEPPLLIGTVQDITSRRLGEEELKKTQSSLVSAQQLAKIGSWEWNVQNNTAIWSDETHRIFEIEKNDLSEHRKNFLDLISPDDRIKVDQALSDALDGVKKYDIEYRICLAGGKEKVVHALAEVIRDKEGKPVVMQGTVQDVTERKQSENVLNQFKYTLDQTLDSIFMFNESDLRFIYVNEGAMKQVGYTRDELLGMTPLDIKPEFTRARFQEMVQPLRDGTQASRNFEAVYRHKKGHDIPVEVFLQLVRKEGVAPRFMAVVHDITVRKRNVEKIEQLNRAYRLLSQVNEAIVRAHDEQELLVAICNLAVEPGLFRFAWIGVLDERSCVLPVASAGVEDGYMAGLNIRLDGERTGKGPIATALRTGRCFVCQEIACDPSMAPWRDDAIRRGYRSSAAFPILRAGNVIGTVNVYAAEAHFFTARIIRLMHELAADVSFALDVFAEKRRRAQAEEEIKRLNVELEHRVMERTRQLETANKELEAFSYSVSHDLRAPLRSIDGFSRVLLDTYHDQLGEAGQDWLERVRSASQHMGHLIEDMLQLSKVSRSVLKREPVDLCKIAKNVADDLRRANPERNARFIFPQSMIVHADHWLLRIVMDNLLGNAFKYTGKKTVAEIELGEHVINGENVYFVRDNGAGFDMKYAHKLFTPFQRLHGTNEFEGTGIGLATVQRIIHRHHGKVWADAKEEQGATFLFTLPQRDMVTRGRNEQ